MLRRETWRHFDFWLFGAVVILSIFGIAMINSAIAGNIDLGNVCNPPDYFCVHWYGCSDSYGDH